MCASSELCFQALKSLAHAQTVAECCRLKYTLGLSFHHSECLIFHVYVNHYHHLWVFLFIVYNWSVEEAEKWLASCVQLPQYVDSFRKNDISGKALPR